MNEKSYYSKKGLVSNSALNWLEKSPELFRKFINGELPDIKASYLETGQLTHLKVLEPEEYEKEVIIYDYITPKSAQQKTFIENFSLLKEIKGVDDALITAYRKSYSTKEDDEKILLKATSLRTQLEGYERYLKGSKSKTIVSSLLSTTINNIDSNIRAHKKAFELMHKVSTSMSSGKADSFNEQEILWEWNGIKCKSLLDRVVVDYTTKTIKLIDFKTTYNLLDFKTSYEKYNYDRQLSFYKKALQSQMHKFVHADHKGEIYKVECYIVVADTKTEEIKVFKIDNLEEPTKKIEDLLTRAKWHMTEAKWEHTMEYYEGDGCEKL